METLSKCAKALGDWVYTIFNVQVPLLNISFWTLVLSLLIFSLFLRTLRRDGTKNKASMGNNNNVVYKDR